MKIQSAFQSIINLDYLLFWIINNIIPLALTVEKTTVKTIFHQFSFPDDPVSQNTVRKRYIQNAHGLSTYVGIS